MVKNLCALAMKDDFLNNEIDRCKYPNGKWF